QLVFHKSYGRVLSSWKLATVSCDEEDGDLKFSLESVKKLKELMDENRSINPRMVVSKTTYSPCNEKDLPEEFQVVCKREDAPMIFERLSIDADLCEICANAACSGCF
uniref:Guanylate cyclase activator 2B n=1 Tax=Anas zonorhyncha TaxID=75864 RepID=A0A8B9VUW3_9AVES